MKEKPILDGKKTQTGEHDNNMFAWDRARHIAKVRRQLAEGNQMPTTDRQVREIISLQLEVDLDRVRDDARLVEDLGADSLAVIETVLAFEERFGVEISDEDLAEWCTVGDAVRFIEARVAPESK